ncbi:uncharacterized protein LOC128212280 isoform X2 [Mya arenaria]|uniref:uncharacterized protein LOC128212280 isoform X2 n=1 Tax=Mya arenaria TaxID=6604 RepID=UPI0022DEB5F4|nr:uncharacterized protein LOC128212280 isoform X2 [Mya arenaria]
MNIFITAGTFCILITICEHFVTVEAASGEWHLKLETLPVNGSDDVVPKQGGDGAVDCGEGYYCRTGTYCCYNGGCCKDGYECCSADRCCPNTSAAGLTRSTLGNIMMLLCCIAGHAIASMKKNTHNNFI